MQQMASARTPMHLWIVGILSLLWNSFGGYDYVMSRTHNADYIKKMMPSADPAVLLAYMDSMPLWASIGWGLGVWGSLLGALLLLLRNQFAVYAFAASLIGCVLSFSYQLFVATNKPPEMNSPVMPAVVFALVAAQLYYAQRMRAKGVLR